MQPTPPSVPIRRSVLIVYGPGAETHAVASELADVLLAAGWTGRVERANPSVTTRTECDLVIGVDADIAAFRKAALNEAPVVTANSGDRPVIDQLLNEDDELTIRTSPIGMARIDHSAAIPIVQRATVSAVERGAQLVWVSPITHQLPLDRITNIDVDVPEPMHRGTGLRPRPTATGAVMTFRSGADSSSVLLHPDDDYTITTPDGSEIVIHIDEHIHLRAKCVRLGTHPTGLRVVHDPTRTTT